MPPVSHLRQLPSALLAHQANPLDLDNPVIKQGNRERLVPMSLDLRKLLYRWMVKQEGDGLFFTSKGTHITPRNYQRDLKALGATAGITGVRFFAVNYLWRGGNLAYLQRILGHSSITVTERYLRSLGIEDLRRCTPGYPCYHDEPFKGAATCERSPRVEVD